MGHRKHSKIDQLDPTVRETVDEMIKTGARYREIVAYIQENGMSISTAEPFTSVGINIKVSVNAPHRI